MEGKRNRLRIAEIMQEKGLTLADLTTKIIRTDKDNNQRTITKATLCSRINGNPSLSNLYEIAEALGVKITELFPEDDQWQNRVMPKHFSNEHNLPFVWRKDKHKRSSRIEKILTTHLLPLPI